MSRGAFTLGSAPGALPLIGHALPLRRRPLDFVASLPAHGDLVTIRIGRKKAYVVCHPELVHRVLSDPGTFDKGGVFADKLRQLVDSALVTCGWAEHQRQRPLVQPAFSRPRLVAYTEIMRQEVTALTASWRPGQEVDVQPVMEGLSARITARTLFSAELGAAAVAEVCQSLPVLGAGVYRRMTAPLGLWEKLPTPGNRRYERALRRLRSVVSQVVRDYRRAGVDHGDMLSMLLAARDETTGARLGDAEVHEQVLTLLAAGTETTASALSWTLHLLGEHPAAQERLHEEVDRLRDGDGGDPGRDRCGVGGVGEVGEVGSDGGVGCDGGNGENRLPTFKEAAGLDYTRRVITESLRLRPPLWLLTRETTTGTELGGHPLPAGSMVVYSPYLIHRDPGLFPGPDRFDPDRWLPERSGKLPRGASLPFGAGARKCVGDVYSMTELVIAVAGIAARWRLVPAPGPVAGMLPKATLAPARLSMVVTPRPSRRRHGGPTP